MCLFSPSVDLAYSRNNSSFWRGRRYSSGHFLLSAVISGFSLSPLNNYFSRLLPLWREAAFDSVFVSVLFPPLLCPLHVTLSLPLSSNVSSPPRLNRPTALRRVEMQLARSRESWLLSCVRGSSYHKVKQMDAPHRKTCRQNLPVDT